MAIASTNGLSNGRFLGVLVLPGTESNGGDLSTGVELENGRHGLVLLFFWIIEYVEDICSSVGLHQGLRSY